MQSNVGEAAFLSGGSGGEFASQLTQVVDGIQFLAVVGQGLCSLAPLTVGQGLLSAPRGHLQFLAM